MSVSDFIWVNTMIKTISISPKYFYWLTMQILPTDYILLTDWMTEYIYCIWLAKTSVWMTKSEWLNEWLHVKDHLDLTYCLHQQNWDHLHGWPHLTDRVHQTDWLTTSEWITTFDCLTTSDWLTISDFDLFYIK